MDILLKNGKIVDPVTGTEAVLDVLIQGSQIAAVGENLEASANAKVIDAGSWVVAPGLVDTHVHFRDPGFTYKEDILTGAAASARGGFTTVVMMANTKPVVDNVETLKANIEKGKQTGIRVQQAAAVSYDLKGKELTDMKALAEAGAVGFTDDGIPLMDDAMVKKAMEEAKALGMPISMHEEHPAFVASPGVNMGKVSAEIGVGGASALSEDIMVARDCMLALATGADVVIQHISSGHSVELVRTAKKMGAHVYAEATPHHFTLTEDAVLKYGTYARMNPPLRTEWDRQEIIKGLQDGTIDVIATDHAPHSEEEKSRPFTQSVSGITGIETSLALGVSTLVNGGYLTMMELMNLMSKKPMELYHLNPQGIQAGAPADLVIFAPEEKFTVGDYKSKATNSPFTGWELNAPVKYTICDGKIVYSSVE